MTGASGRPIEMNTKTIQTLILAVLAVVGLLVYVIMSNR